MDFMLLPRCEYEEEEASWEVIEGQRCAIFQTQLTETSRPTLRAEFAPLPPDPETRHDMLDSMLWGDGPLPPYYCNDVLLAAMEELAVIGPSPDESLPWKIRAQMRWSGESIALMIFMRDTPQTIMQQQLRCSNMSLFERATAASSPQWAHLQLPDPVVAGIANQMRYDPGARLQVKLRGGHEIVNGLDVDPTNEEQTAPGPAYIPRLFLLHRVPARTVVPPRQ